MTPAMKIQSEKFPFWDPARVVVVFVFLLLFSSLMQIHKLIVDRDWYVDTYSYMPPWLTVTRYAFSWFQRLVGILIAVGLLAHKELARKAAILLGWFTILTLYWKHPYPGFKLHAQYLDRNLGYLLPRGIGVSFESVVWLSIIGHCLVDIAFCSLMIYCMTRPAVKALFRSPR
jgi:hypothetical protein